MTAPDVAIELPPLPPLDAWSAGQVIRMDKAQELMAGYARVAVMAERKRLRSLCRKHLHISFDLWDERIVPAIRKGT